MNLMIYLLHIYLLKNNTLYYFNKLKVLYLNTRYSLFALRLNLLNNCAILRDYFRKHKALI